MRRQRLLGLALASALSVIPIARTAVSPLCALYTPDNIEWYLFFCYLPSVVTWTDVLAMALTLAGRLV